MCLTASPFWDSRKVSIFSHVRVIRPWGWSFTCMFGITAILLALRDGRLSCRYFKTLHLCALLQQCVGPSSPATLWQSITVESSHLSREWKLSHPPSYTTWTFFLCSWGTLENLTLSWSLQRDPVCVVAFLTSERETAVFENMKLVDEQDALWERRTNVFFEKLSSHCNVQ